MLSQKCGVSKAEWSEKIAPDEEDFVRFALFNDKVSHRTLRTDQLTETILQNWRTKEIHVLLHMYSTAVNNKAVFQSVLRIRCYSQAFSINSVRLQMPQ